MLCVEAGSLFAVLGLFIVQTFYKALLFMSAGNIITANDGKEEITELSSAAMSKPMLAATLIGVLSIAAIFPFAGFFAKYAIMHSATSIVTYALLLAIELTTSLYIFRWLFLPRKNTAYKSSFNYVTLPKTMKGALLAAAVLCAAASLVYFYLPALLGYRDCDALLHDLPARFRQQEKRSAQVPCLRGLCQRAALTCNRAPLHLCAYAQPLCEFNSSVCRTAS